MRAGFKCAASPPCQQHDHIGRQRSQILRLFRQLFGTPPPKFGPGRAGVINQINRALFNLDKLLFMRYIYFKCNKDRLAEALICIFGEQPSGEIATRAPDA
jgi:hypothetical protein